MMSAMRPRSLLVLCTTIVAACGGGGSSATGSDAAPDVSIDSTVPPTPIARTTTSLDGQWRFFGSNDLAAAASPTFDDSAWSIVHVPHTWNGMPAPVGGARPFPTWSHAWYRTRFRTSGREGARVFVCFEGVATIADVFVDGARLGQHRGAYTRFVFDATDALDPTRTDHVLAVLVDDTDEGANDVIPPRAVARPYFRTYGGIYRKARLVETDPIHVDLLDDASSGVYATLHDVSAASAGLHVVALAHNDVGAAREVEVRHALLDGETEVATWSAKVNVEAKKTAISTTETTISAPRLWSPSDPHLYRLRTRIVVDDVVRDETFDRVGFRSFHLSPTSFTVNGANLPLRGVSKHQETEAHQSAVTDDELRADWDRLQELGVDFVRLVHYPHAPLELDLADERGVVTWVENGLVIGAPWTATGDRITREMVKQNFNHPSIAFFGAGNEAAPDGDKYADLRDAVVRYAKAIREEDPSRIVVYASNSHFSDPSVDAIAQNVYEGWYWGTAWDFAADSASLHYVSETGGRAVITHHSEYAAPRMALGSFEPEEFLQVIAESRAQIVFRDQPDAVPLFAWWAFRDFLLDGRPHGVNDSGLVSYDGARRKDAFFLMQAFLRPDLPVIHVASATYFVRKGNARNGIKVYSNRPRLHLSIEGVDVGAFDDGAYKQPDGHRVDHVFIWNAPLHSGMNELVVRDDDGHSESIAIYFAGAGGLPPVATRTSLVRSLASSNAGNPAYFFDRAIEPDFPVFHDLDGTADETWAEIPPILAGARPIVTGRTSAKGHATDLSFAIDPSSSGADVFVVASVGAVPAFVDASGFVDVGVDARWRDAEMDLVACRIFRRRLAAGESIALAAANVDYAVLVKP